MKNEFKEDIKIIADTGMRTTGDILSFSFGRGLCDVRTDACANLRSRKCGVYSGMASAAACSRNGKRSSLSRVNRRLLR